MTFLLSLAVALSAFLAATHFQRRGTSQRNVLLIGFAGLVLVFVGLYVVPSLADLLPPRWHWLGAAAVTYSLYAALGILASAGLRPALMREANEPTA